MPDPGVTRWLAASVLAGAVAALAAAGLSASASSSPNPAQRGHGLAPSRGWQSATAASCVGLTRAQQQEAARVIVIGHMLAGPSRLVQHRRVLLSPAKFRVSRYVKGSGPRTVDVQTGARLRNGQIQMSEDGILPSAGQRWEILSSTPRMPLQTSICLGSRRLPEQRSRH